MAPAIVQINPGVLGGQPVIKGTRIPIARILALVGMDYKLADMKKELPQLRNLTNKDLAAILAYYRRKIVS